jgi:hypothetical protein
MEVTPRLKTGSAHSGRAVIREADIAIARPDGRLTVIDLCRMSPRLREAMRGMDEVRRGLTSVDAHLAASRAALRHAGRPAS